MHKFISIILLVSISVLVGCTGAKGHKPSDKRNAINQMRQETLSDLYKYSPSAKKRIQNAYGYAVFSNLGINLLMVSTGQGYGVAKNNISGKNTYMKMFSAGVGVGLGVKDFRGVFVFDNEKVFKRFITTGWDASGQADAAGKLDKKGASATMAIELAPGVSLYQLTKSGLALQATLQGTKYWKDDELN